MSFKNQALRDLVVERLAVAADEIFALFERTFAEYEEEFLRTKSAQETRVQLTVVQPLSVPPDVNQSPEPIQGEHSPVVKKETSLELPVSSLPVKSEEIIEKPTFLQHEPVKEHRQETTVEQSMEEEPGCSLDLQLDNNKQSHSCSDTDDSNDWEPAAKRRTKNDEQDPDFVLIEDSNPDARLRRRGVFRGSLLDVKKPGCSSETADLQPNSFPPSAPEDERPNSNQVREKVSSKCDRTTKAKQLECPECGKKFKRGPYFQKHMSAHSRDPFRCSFCNRTFHYESRLIAHMRGHTNEKPFSCSICKKAFGQMYYLNRHMRIHSNKNPFSCPECGMGFRQQNSLYQHMAGFHRGEKPHS